MNETNLETAENKSTKFFQELGWILSGFFKSCFSIGFYRRAVKRSVFQAAVFFTIFGLFSALISTLILAYNMISINEDLAAAFKNGSFPTITIKDGRAYVDGSQPYVLDNGEGTVVIIDTTGQIKEIDRTQYYKGFLLTRDDLFILSDGKYQRMTLGQLNREFDTNPIIIDEVTTVRWWTSFSGIFSVLAYISIAFWNIIVRGMLLSFLAVLLWGLTSLFKTGQEYGHLLVIGMYAFVPATYIYFIFNRLDLTFFLMHTLLLVMFWVVFTFFSRPAALQAALPEDPPLVSG